jgi:hypothetical protein
MESSGHYGPGQEQQRGCWRRWEQAIEEETNPAEERPQDGSYEGEERRSLS